MGRLVYVDPVGEDIGNNITHPYEDYCIAVDLMIRIPNRYSCGFSKNTGEEKLLKYSFFGGTSLSNTNKGYLTTNFTDISMTDPKSNTSECFGIESISINYNEKLFPVVTIKFVDIRGATLMSPSEAMYYNNDKDVQDSRGLYRAFFTMPYPTFLLYFKGFYGKGTTLRLTLQKADIEFNSENGNFNINATFIGQMYGIYADLPLTYLAIIPYTDEGKKYWDEQVENGRFKFRDDSKSRTQNMIKLPELRHKIASISENQDIIKLEKDKEIVSDEMEAKIEGIKKLYNSYPFNTQNNDKEMYKWKTFGSKKYYYLMVPTEDDVKKIGKEIYEYYKSVSEYESGELEKTYTKKLEMGFLKSLDAETINDSTLYETLSKYSIKINVSTYSGEEYTYSSTYATEGFQKYNNFTIKLPHDNPYNGSDIDNIITTDEFREALTDNSQSDYVYLCYFKQITADDIFGDIQKKQNDLKSQKTELEKKYENEKLKLIQDVIGFKPSVRNMYELIFAHMETFMHCFYSNTKEIKTELDTHDKVRAKEYQGVTDENTDIPRAKLENGELNNIYNFLPPYTAFYKKNGDEAPKMVLPNEVANNPNELREMHFIESLIGASQIYINESYTHDFTNNNKNNNTQGAPSTTITSFIPLTSYDFINKDKIGNPYSFLNGHLNDKIEDIEALILGVFALRAYYYLAGETDTRADRVTFGEIEAINLFKALGDNFVNETNNGNAFLSFIAKYAEGDDLGKDKRGFANLLSSTESSIWKLNGNTPLFDEDLTTFNYEMLPLGNFNPVTLKTAYNTNTYNDSFLDTTVDIITGYTGNGSDRKIIANSKTENSFFIFNDRNYCKQIVDNIEKYINSEEVTSIYGARTANDKIEIRNPKKIKKVYNRLLNLKFEDVYYHEDTFENVNKNEIKTMLSTGKGINDDKFFIKYPSWVDEKKNKSIFDHYAYKLNFNNNRFQAYLFIHSLPITGLDDNDGNIMKENKNGIALKALLLREGAHYWYKDNFNDITTSGSVNGHNVSFKLAKGDEQYILDDVNIGMETVEILSYESVGKYDKWKYPINCTNSRINTLKQNFIEWADNDFSKYKIYLEDNKLYNNDKISEGLKKSSGLTGSLNVKINDLQKFLKETFFEAYTVMELYDDVDTDFKEGKDQKITCVAEDIKNAFKFFMKELHKIYGALTTDMKNKGQETVERTINYANIQADYATNDTRLATYMTLKSLYEKWLCSPHNGPFKTWTLDSSVAESDFNRFVYLDSFHKDIGDEFLINLGNVDEWLSSCLPTINKETSEVSFSLNTKSTYELLALMAEKSGAMLMAIPQKLGVYDTNNIKELFKPLPLNSEWLENDENFVFMYSYQASKHLGSVEMKTMDINGYPGDGDGVDLEKEGEVYFNEEGLPVPGFAVTYAKQNQSLFKNIRLNTTDAGVTDVSIANTMNIAAQAATGPRETVLYGQDIYHVNSNKSFMCEVECMGNAQIIPLMYFQLNNIPFWSGAYQVLKVSHDISPGNFITKFKGIRLNRYKIPLTKGEILITKRGVGDNTSTVTSTTKDTVGGSRNSKNNRNYDIEANPNHVLDSRITVDFDENNVSWKNPIICIIPGHGPDTKKKTEWRFNYSVATKIKEILSNKTHKVDGKDVKYNIQLCNKEGTFTSSNGYRTTEVQQLCMKYGSHCVISIAVHWNGGYGNAVHVYVNKASVGVRTDSTALANTMVVALKKMSTDIKSLNTVPSGMSNGTPRIINLPENNTDGGVNINCACVLTENFFADFPKEKMIAKKKGSNITYTFNEGTTYVTDALGRSIPPYNKIIDGRYATVRGWFEGEQMRKKGDEPYDTEGVRVIAQGNVNGIIDYIESLQELKGPRK